MSAWEQNHENPSRRNGSPRSSELIGTRDSTRHGSDGTAKTGQAVKETEEAAGRSLAALRAPIAEKGLAAVHAVRGGGARLWTAVRVRRAAVGGTIMGAAVALTGAYALGRRTGLRSRGPLSRLTGGRI